MFNRFNFIFFYWCGNWQ